MSPPKRKRLRKGKKGQRRGLGVVAAFSLNLAEEWTSPKGTVDKNCRSTCGNRCGHCTDSNTAPWLRHVAPQRLRLRPGIARIAKFLSIRITLFMTLASILTSV